MCTQAHLCYRTMHYITQQPHLCYCIIYTPTLLYTTHSRHTTLQAVTTATRGLWWQSGCIRFSLPSCPAAGPVWGMVPLPVCFTSTQNLDGESHHTAGVCRCPLSTLPIAQTAFFSMLYCHCYCRSQRQAVEKNLLQCSHRNAAQLYVMALESVEGTVTQVRPPLSSFCFAS